MYLFIYVGRALNCHKNIDITDMMHSDESFPLELYKCFVYQERQESLEWYLSPPLLFICLLCTDCLCLHGTCARCCSCHNYHNLKLVTQYNLWPEATCCSFWYLQHRYYCQKRNKSNTLLQHVEIVECFVKTKLFDRHFEPAMSPTRVPAPGEWLSSVQSRSKLRKCCGCCRNVSTMQLTLRFAGLLTNKCDFINKRTFRHHNKLTQPDWLDSVKYL